MTSEATFAREVMGMAVRSPKAQAVITGITDEPLSIVLYLTPLEAHWFFVDTDDA